MCKRWKLLRQAADTFARLTPAHNDRICRLGGRHEQALPQAAGRLRVRIVFTTLQTWYNRRDRLPAAVAALGTLAVLWDEVHSGFRSRIGRTFRRAYRRRVPVLGLTATQTASNRAEVIYRKSPEE